MEKNTMQSDTIQSAVLTATINSLELMKKMNAKQSEIAKTAKEIQESQKRDSALIKKIENLPTRNDIKDIEEKVDIIQQSLLDIDLNSLVTSIIDNEQAMMDKLESMNGNDKQEILNAIKASNSHENLKTIKQLIEGLKTLQGNVTTVAERMEILSNNVKGSRNETRKLATTIIDSNARVTSMDMRMASLTNDQSGNTSVEGTVDAALDFLTSLNQQTSSFDDVYEEDIDD